MWQHEQNSWHLIFNNSNSSSSSSSSSSSNCCSGNSSGGGGGGGGSGADGSISGGGGGYSDRGWGWLCWWSVVLAATVPAMLKILPWSYIP